MVFVPDDVDEIACTVRAMAGAVELVLTSGGIGPTLDDLTMQGVARAVGQPLIRCAAGDAGACAHGCSLTTWYDEMA